MFDTALFMTNTCFNSKYKKLLMTNMCILLPPNTTGSFKFHRKNVIQSPDSSRNHE